MIVPTRKLRRWIDELEEFFPLIVPARVYRRRGVPNHGISSLFLCSEERPWYFTVCLGVGLDAAATWDSLIHEWAHCRTWREGRTLDDHDAAWGVEYAAIYSELANQ